MVKYAEKGIVQVPQSRGQRRLYISTLEEIVCVNEVHAIRVWIVLLVERPQGILYVFLSLELGQKVTYRTVSVRRAKRFLFALPDFYLMQGKKRVARAIA